ncbi:MAG: TonB-dependent receptor, partial [Pseudomonadota bacterium]
TALTGDDLRAKQIEGFTDIQLYTPNVSFSKSQFTASTLAIRGVTNLAVASTSSANVSIHQNDIPQLASRLFETEFYDVERVEVLRGPQGTLFGRNATGGVVNVITNKASVEEVEAFLEGEYGNFDSSRITGMVNVPLGDSLAFRLAGTAIQRDGYTENITTGNDIDNRDLFSIRGSLRWYASDRTTIDLTASYFEEDDNRTSFQKRRCNADVVLGCATGLIGQPGFDSELGFDDVATSGTINSIASTATFGALGGLIAESLVPSLITGGQLAPGDAAAFSNDLIQAWGALALLPTGVDLASVQGLSQPTDLRQVAEDFDPQYFADELFISLNLAHDLDNLSFKLNLGYGETTVDSIRDTDAGAGVQVTLPDFGALPNVLSIYEAYGILPAGSVPVGTQLGLANFFSGGVPTSNLSESGLLSGDIITTGDTLFGVEQSIGESTYYSIEGIVSTDFDGPVNFLAGVNYIVDESEEGADFNVSLNAFDYFSVVGGTLLAQTLGTLGQLQPGAPDPAAIFATSPFSFYTPTFNNDARDSKLESLSVFGEVYWDITDTLSFTGGVRYNQDTVSTQERNAFAASFNNFLALSAGAPVTPVPAVVPVPTSQADLIALLDTAAPFTDFDLDFDAVTGRAVLNWAATDNANYYVSFSRGFRPGGVNPSTGGQAGGADTFDDETVLAYEIGAKLVGLSGALRANLAAFYYDYTGFQLPNIIGITAVNDNADLDIFGLEGEFLFLPTDNTRINLTLSYLETEIKDFSTVDTANPAAFTDADVYRDVVLGSACVVDNNGLPSLIGSTVPGLGTLTPFVPLCSTLSDIVDGVNATLPVGAPQYEFFDSGIPQDLSGNELPQAPNYSIAIGGEHDFRFADGSMIFTPRADYYYQGEFFGSQFNREADVVEAYGNLNLQATLQPEDGPWYIRLFAQNVFDSENVQGQFTGSQAQGSYINQFIQEPLRYGGAIGVRF